MYLICTALFFALQQFHSVFFLFFHRSIIIRVLSKYSICVAELAKYMSHSPCVAQQFYQKEVVDAAEDHRKIVDLLMLKPTGKKFRQFFM